MSACDAACAALEADFDATIERLQELIRIPSCSFAGFDPAALRHSAESCATWLRQAGLPEVELIEGCGAGPQVLARDHGAGPEQPTLLLYAHHDVQPPMRPELWHSPAFEPSIRDGRLYGRGSADDKAGVAVIAAACAAWRQSAGRLPINVTVLIDSEEEIGSPHLDQLLDREGDRLQADVLAIADLVNIAVGQPSLTVALRGMAALEVTVTGLRAPAHSGMWGGPLPDAAAVLARLIAGCSDADGRLTIPDLPAPSLPAGVLDDLPRLPWDADRFAEQAGLLGPLATDGPSTYRRLWYEPALSVNGIHAGGEPGQAGNVLVDRAWARLSLRLAPGQDPDACLDALAAQLRRAAPASVDLQIEREPGTAPAWTTSTEHPAFAAAMQAVAAGYDHPAVTIGCGGTIPFVGRLCQRLGGIPAILLPVEDPASKAHAENESVHLGDLLCSARSLVHYLALLQADA